ncbi:unnamed protein product [Paramecium sonneborni]|uniref:Peptidase M14 domain-containing protein n=1 Tax=Paramecium sonneborni TaxID=65129 RepID=A0A8S1KN52_9CILI|nr:unnamed protein product [Paramecium sonneborni]
MKKLLKTNKDLGNQYLDFTQLFEKKLKQPTINNDSKKELIEQYRQRNFKHEPQPFYESSEIIVYGSFENSNIMAVQQEGNELNILLNGDTNTNGCTQWFYFGILVKQPQQLTFRILNNRRGKSLLKEYNHIRVYDNNKWNCETTKELYYYRTNINHPFYHSQDSSIANLQQNFPLHTLQFNYNFTQNKNIVYFALTMPYTVSNLYHLVYHSSLKHKVLCSTPLGLPIFKLKTKHKTSEVVIILARQHPSESVGSHICEEIIKLLDSGHQVQNKYRCVVFPMLNPDGVFLGNSRCNFNGVDLNRKWDMPNQTTEPEIYNVVKHIKKYKVAFLIDLHGHSKKLNQFLYGCATQIKHISDYMRVKQFSRLLQQGSDLFSYNNCSFSITPDRVSTARVAMWKKFQIANSMTIETSLYGGQKKPFEKEEFNLLAQNILNALFQYNEYQSDPHLYDAQEINQAIKLIKKDGIDDKESGSDSDAEQDIIVTRNPRLKVTSRRDSTPLMVKSKPKQQSETPIQQPTLFFKNEQTYSFKKIPSYQMKRKVSRMNSFQSQIIDEPLSAQLPTIYNIPTKQYKGTLDLIQALQVKSLSRQQ